MHAHFLQALCGKACSACVSCAIKRSHRALRCMFMPLCMPVLLCEVMHESDPTIVAKASKEASSWGMHASPCVCHMAQRIMMWWITSKCSIVPKACTCMSRSRMRLSVIDARMSMRCAMVVDVRSWEHHGPPCHVALSMVDERERGAACRQDLHGSFKAWRWHHGHGHTKCDASIYMVQEGG